MIEVLGRGRLGSKLVWIVAAVERSLLTDPIRRSDTARSAYEALRHLEARAYDLVILDLQIPRRPGEDPIPDVGIELLDAIERRQTYLQPAFVIGLTAYDELADKARKAFEKYLWHVVKYRDDSKEWEAPIATVPDRLSRAGGDCEKYGVDVAP